MADPRKEQFRQRTKAYALAVVRFYCLLPKTRTEVQILGKQLLRSGTSVAANYREASRARSKAEFISKIGDCLKEADETLYWLDLLSDEQVISPKRLAPLIKEANELVSIFVTISKRSRGD